MLLGCLVLTTAQAGPLAPPTEAAHPRPEPTVRIKKHGSAHARRSVKAAHSFHNRNRAAPRRQTDANRAEVNRADVNREVMRAIRVAERKAKADPAVLTVIAWQESRFDPKARNQHSSARGLLQFTTVTWLTVVRDFGARHGLARYAAAIKTGRDGRLTVTPHALRRKILALRDNPELAAIMAAERLQQERGALEAQLGRPARPADLYMLHFLGPTGAREFLTALARSPNKPSIDVVGRVAEPNRSLFIRDGHVLTVADTYNMIEAALR